MSNPTAPRSSADCNLLFGILALQMDFISRDALISAMNAWVLEKSKPLGQILTEQGALSVEDGRILETLVQRHLGRHGNDIEKSLAALAPAGALRDGLKQIADPDLQASLVHVASIPPPNTEGLATVVTGGGTPNLTNLRFTIVRPHAQGGLGEIYVALDEDLHREVALKEIQARHAHHPENHTRFVREAEITGRLEHPGIVPIYWMGQYADGRPFYAMRFIRGETLKDAIDRFHQGGISTDAMKHGRRRRGGSAQRIVEFRQLLSRFIAVCNTMAYAHSRGVIHRDLKPANIMLGNYGETLVVDWGLARLIEHREAGPEYAESLLQLASATGHSELTQFGRALGTPAYMSPEQAIGQLDRVGPASDVYSLGATLYYLLTGRAPFTETSLPALFQRVQKGVFPPPREINPGVPRALDAICVQAMALKPEDRYRTAQVLAEDIEHWLADEPVQAYTDSFWERMARRARRHRHVVIGVGMLLVTAILALAIGIVLIKDEQLQTEHQRQITADRETTARRLLYVAHMNLADRAWETRNVARLRELVDFHRTSGEREDLRGFEWYHFAKLAQMDVFSVAVHSGPILCIAFSPLGDTIATGGGDMQVKVWDVATGKERSAFGGQKGSVTAIAYSPDGKLLVSASQDKTATVWDVRSGKALARLDGHAGAVTSVCFSPDGKSVATGSEDRTVRVWDVPQKSVKVTLSAHHAAVTCLAFSPDGKSLASGGADRTLYVWDVDHQRSQAALVGHRAAVRALAFSPSGNLLATGGDDKAVLLWDPQRGKRLELMPQPAPVNSLAFSADAALEKLPDARIELVAVGLDDSTVKLWTLENAPGAVRNYTDRVIVQGHGGPVRCVAFSPDGKTLATASDDHTARLWQANTGQPLVVKKDEQAPLRGHTHWVYSASFSPDCRMLATAGADHTVRLWDIEKGAELATFHPHSRWIYAVRYTADGKSLATASADSTAKLLDAATGQVRSTFHGHTDEVWEVIFAPDGRTIATCGKDKTARLWDLATGQELKTFAGHADEVWGIAFSPDGKTLATASNDRTVKLWDVSSGAELATLSGHTDGATSVAFSPDGRFLASGSKDKTVRIWDLPSLQERAILKGHESLVFKLAFSPDGRTLASCSWDQSIQLWNTATWLEVCALRGHTDAVFCVAFSPDGRMLASTCRDHSVRIWSTRRE